MVAARGHLMGEAVEFRLSTGVRPATDPASMAETLLVAMDRVGLTAAEVAAVVAELPRSRTTAARRLADIRRDEAA